MDSSVRNVFTYIEKCFNVAGSTPIVSLFSGTLRAIAGKVQTLAGAIMATVGFIGFLINHNQKWAGITNIGSEFIIHGALNTLRGLGEALLCAYTLVGNVLLLIPNMSKKEPFSPFFTYGTLSNPELRQRSIYI